MKEKIIIIGGKGTAVVIAEQIYDACHNYNKNIELLGFAFDDPLYAEGINDWPVLCGTKDVYYKYGKYNDVKFIFQLYRYDLLIERIALRESLGIPIEKFCSFIHPTVYVAKSARLGNGNIILANCVINSNFKMGNFNTINSCSLLGHDSIMGDNNFFAGHTCIGSNITIGSGNFTGLNASLKNFIQVGNNNLIGMASNVTKNLSNNKVVVGNPAKEIIK